MPLTLFPTLYPAQLLLSIAALGCLCLSLERHARQATVRTPMTCWRAVLRVSGWLILASLTAIAVVRPGWGYSLLEWIGTLSLAALGVIALATWRARWLPRIVLLSVVTGIPMLLHAAL